MSEQSADSVTPCATADPALFEAADWDAAQPALSYCETCPAVERERCAGLRAGTAGVWGGEVWGSGGYQILPPAREHGARRCVECGAWLPKGKKKFCSEPCADVARRRAGRARAALSYRKAKGAAA